MLHILGSEEPNKFFFPGDINEFYWGLASFLIVLGLLAWKVFPIAGKALRERTERIADELAAADKAQEAADVYAAALLAKLGDADADAATIVSEAQAAAEQVETDGVAKANTDAVALKARVETEIGAAKDQATADLRGELSRKAMAAAEAVVTDNLDEGSQAELIEQYISQVGAS